MLTIAIFSFVMTNILVLKFCKKNEDCRITIKNVKK